MEIAMWELLGRSPAKQASKQTDTENQAGLGHKEHRGGWRGGTTHGCLLPFHQQLRIRFARHVRQTAAYGKCRMQLLFVGVSVTVEAFDRVDGHSHPKQETLRAQMLHQEVTKAHHLDHPPFHRKLFLSPHEPR